MTGVSPIIARMVEITKVESRNVKGPSPTARVVRLTVVTFSDGASVTTPLTGRAARRWAIKNQGRRTFPAYVANDVQIQALGMMMAGRSGTPSAGG